MMLTRHEAELSQGLDSAAAARREAAARQDRAKHLCIECHGPDGEHTSECGMGAAKTRFYFDWKGCVEGRFVSYRLYVKDISMARKECRKLQAKYNTGDIKVYREDRQEHVYTVLSAENCKDRP